MTTTNIKVGDNFELISGYNHKENFFNKRTKVTCCNNSLFNLSFVKSEKYEKGKVIYKPCDCILLPHYEVESYLERTKQ